MKILEEAARIVAKAKRSKREPLDLDRMFDLLHLLRGRWRAEQRAVMLRARKAKHRRKERAALLAELKSLGPLQPGDELADGLIANRFAEVDNAIAGVLKTRQDEVVALLVGLPVPSDSAKMLEKGAIMTAEDIGRMTPREIRILGLDRATYEKVDAAFGRAQARVDELQEEAHRGTREFRLAKRRVELSALLAGRTRHRIP